ncbi:MAG: 16S rRNA (cytidine(1402)-2'-O)-methyltransferase [Saccharospirillum sp.]|nr:16S rRNA (cytidine(1402)-2'-O)-methyltransferase [Saccharospirillum sp.]
MTDRSNLPSALFVVATPIGNLDDLTARGRSVLCSVDVCCAEDTRHSRRLLDHIGASPRMVSLHEHNEEQRADFIISLLEQGQSVALVSDAGTPLISDPGFVLVRAVIAAGYDVTPVPGVSAVITALSVAGLPTDRWVFEGFLPAKSGTRSNRLASLASETRTLVFYESSHRILASLTDMAEVFGPERQAVVGRELTKTFETLLRGTLAEVLAQVADDPNQQKGEFVVMVAGTTEQTEQTSMDADRLAGVLAPLMPPKQAAATMVELLGGRKKEWYERILTLNKTP